MSGMRTFFLTGVILLLLLLPAHGNIYKWTDRNGKVHFTDNIDAVPAEYRQQVEEKTTITPSERLQTAPPSALPAATRPEAGTSYVVPLRRVGNTMTTEVVLNGVLKLSLMVDTGASLTLLSTATAKRLALNLEDTTVLPLRSVSGIFLAPLTKLNSLAVGNATVRDVDVVVYDMSSGTEDGLLGMSFLDNFQVTIDATKGQMTLSPLSAAPGEALYDDRPEEWWRRKFRYFRQQIALLDDYLRQHASPKLTRTRQYFQAELEALERKASLAAVPRQWRY
jgi:clan AA aspartic protease (TIGR02281 family)